MAEPTDRKLYLGPRLRMLRRELGINQTQMAEELGISPSYMNHLERNQRPLTAQMLLRLAGTYDIDMRDFVSGAGGTSMSDLGEVFADSLVRDIGVPRHEVLELAENYPAAAEAVIRLYRALADLRRAPDRLSAAGAEAGDLSPTEWLRDYLQQRRNHLPEIDAAAEALAAGFSEDPAELQIDLRARLKDGFGVTTRVLPDATLGGALRHYDMHRRRLMLSERLPASGRLFAMAYELALLALEAPLAEAANRAAPPDQETAALLRVALANYAAAALVMPYRRVLRAAEEARYDLPLLQARFGVSFEQLAHRLTTLGRQGERGIPFFMLKVDAAGNVSKRFAGDTFPFARFGGACPRWNIHRALHEHGSLVTQLVETPDGNRFFTLCRSVERPGALSGAAVGLGCEAKHVGGIVHADAYAAARLDPTAIGPACRLCERLACPDRATPPVTRTLEMSAHHRGVAPYPFRAI